METALLREIGAALLKEIKGGPQSPISTGAGGDKTYPIDKRAEEIIIEGLKKSGEPLTIISEEAGVVELKGGGRRVVIDPIDGSRNAVTGVPFYCTSIAIADGDRVKDIMLSYVINLVNGDEFWAGKGQGAYLNGSQISTSGEEELRICAYEAQAPGRDIPAIMPLLSKFHRSRCLGATALDLAYLSAGSFSLFVTPALSRSFDFAGGFLLVKESGGVFTDIGGNEVEGVELGLKRASSILASANTVIHKKALKLLEELL